VSVLLAGRPRDPAWSEVEKNASDAFREAGPQCEFSPEELEHRRGHFPALKAGVSYGGGQGRPGNLKNTARNAAVLASLLATVSFIRLAGFAESEWRGSICSLRS
jgi:hypothetical protein